MCIFKMWQCFQTSIQRYHARSQNFYTLGPGLSKTQHAYMPRMAKMIHDDTCCARQGRQSDWSFLHAATSRDLSWKSQLWWIDAVDVVCIWLRLWQDFNGLLSARCHDHEMWHVTCEKVGSGIAIELLVDKIMHRPFTFIVIILINYSIIIIFFILAGSCFILIISNPQLWEVHHFTSHLGRPWRQNAPIRGVWASKFQQLPPWVFADRSVRKFHDVFFEGLRLDRTDLIFWHHQCSRRCLHRHTN